MGGFERDKNDASIEGVYNRNNNSFDILRFILATLVIYSHCYPLLYGTNHHGDLLTQLSNNQVSFGTLAVNGFFSISGFLIAQSMVNSRSYFDYLWRRLLRIIPAFLVSLLLISFVLGPLLTSLDIKTYFSLDNQYGNPFSFVFYNITFNIFNYSWTVQDLFSGNIFPGSANGSMWTLKHEFVMYLLLPILSFFLIIRYRVLMAALTVGVCLLAVLNMKYGYSPFQNTKLSYWILGPGEYSAFINLAPYFLIGSLIYLYKDLVRVHIKLLALVSIVFLIGLLVIHNKYIVLLTFPYIIISLGVLFKYSKFSKYGDYSYGLYIYTFPVQQYLVYSFSTHLSIGTLFLYSFTISLVLSFFSWRFIEKPALSLKNTFNIVPNKNNKKMIGG